MNLFSIEMEGYSSYKDYTNVQIPQGITGIIGSFDGRLNKSNATGKSSLVMAILYALFGEGEANTIDEYINDNSEEMFVRIKYELNGVDYSLERGIRKKSSYLDCYINNDPKNRLGDNIKTTQAAIIETLGMDYNMLTASNFFEQSGMDKFINTEPSVRRNYIDKVLQLELWRKALKEVTSDVKKADDLILNLQTKIDSFKTEIEEIKNILKDKNNLQNDILIISKEKEDLQKKINAYSTIKTILDSLKSNKTILESEINRFSRNEKLIESFLSNITIYEDDLKKLNIIPIYLKYKEEYEKFIIDIENVIECINKEIEKIDSKKYDLLKQTFEIEANIKSNNDKINKIISGICPTCKQIVNIDLLEKENEEIKKDLDILKNKHLELKVEIDQKDKEKQEFNVQLTTAHNQLKETNNKIIKINNDETKRQFDISSLEVKLIDSKKQVSLLNDEQKLNKEKITFLEKTIFDLEEKSKDISDLENDYNTNLILLSSCNKKLDTINFSLGILNEKENQKIKLEDDLKNTEILLNDTREMRKYDEELRIIYTEIPRQLFNSSISLIEEFANDLIHQIMPEVSVTIYEDTSKKALPIIIGFEINGKYRSYKRLSGGQRTIVNIGIRLGFSRVISLQSKSNIKFIVMDEPFGSLDEENRSLVKKILTLISNYFNQILIITHTEDSDSFPNTINVRMSSDYISYIAD